MPHCLDPNLWQNPISHTFTHFHSGQLLFTVFHPNSRNFTRCFPVRVAQNSQTFTRFHSWHLIFRVFHPNSRDFTSQNCRTLDQHISKATTICLNSFCEAAQKVKLHCFGRKQPFCGRIYSRMLAAKSHCSQSGTKLRISALTAQIPDNSKS